MTRHIAFACLINTVHFKLEFVGHGMIANSAKLHIGVVHKELEDGQEKHWDADLPDNIYRDVQKLAHKGLSKRQNTHIGYDNFKTAIDQRITSGGQNAGIRVVDGSLHMYTCKRDCVSYFYAKRAVLSDGVTTVPLRR